MLVDCQGITERTVSMGHADHLPKAWRNAKLNCLSAVACTTAYKFDNEALDVYGGYKG